MDTHLNMVAQLSSLSTPDPKYVAVEEKISPARVRRPVPTPRRSLTVANLLEAPERGSGQDQAPITTTPPKPKPRRSLENIGSGIGRKGQREESEPEKTSVYQNMRLTPEGFLHVNSNLGFGRSVRVQQGGGRSGSDIPGTGIRIADTSDGTAGSRKVLKSRRNSKSNGTNGNGNGYASKTTTPSLKLEPMAGSERERGGRDGLLSCTIL